MKIYVDIFSIIAIFWFILFTVLRFTYLKKIFINNLAIVTLACLMGFTFFLALSVTGIEAIFNIKMDDDSIPIITIIYFFAVVFYGVLFLKDIFIISLKERAKYENISEDKLRLKRRRILLIHYIAFINFLFYFFYILYSSINYGLKGLIVNPGFIFLAIGLSILLYNIIALRKRLKS